MQNSMARPKKSAIRKYKFDFDKEFLYLSEQCIVSKQKIYVGRYILDHPELFEKYTNCRIIILDALFHSAAVNINKIVRKDEEINIFSFAEKTLGQDWLSGNEYKGPVPQESDLKALLNRRNKSLAHADRKNITLNMNEKYPLHIEMLERIIDATESILQHIYLSEKSRSLGGIDQITGKFTTDLDRRIQMECEIAMGQFNVYNGMLAYMKKHNSLELLNIIYSNEGARRNGQTENAHAE